MIVLDTIYLNGCNYQYGYDVIETNKIDGYFKVRLYGILNVTNNYIAWSSGSANVHYTNANLATRYNKGSYTLCQGDWDFYVDGNGNINQSIGGGLNTTFVSGSSVSTISLHMDRYPSITSAPNFTDEENPTIKFNSYGTYPLRAKIEAGGNSQLIIRDISNKSATSYTFGLTNDERDRLVSLAGKNETLSVRFTICAMSGNTELAVSYVDRTLTIKPKGRIYINRSWKRAIAYIGKNGKWNRMQVYIGKENKWKRGI